MPSSSIGIPSAQRIHPNPSFNPDHRIVASLFPVLLAKNTVSLVAVD